MKTEARITIYSAYWSLYIGQHHRPANRAVHYLGSVTAVILLAAAPVLQIWWLALAAPAAALGLGMLGHVLFERTPPEKHRYPIWALASDFRMLTLFLAGRRRESWTAADQTTGVVK